MRKIDIMIGDRHLQARSYTMLDYWFVDIFDCKAKTVDKQEGVTDDEVRELMTKFTSNMAKLKPWNGINVTAGKRRGCETNT